LLIVGGDATVKVAVLLVAPVPPLVDDIAPVVLFFTPEVVPVTFTWSVQVVPGVVMLPLLFRVIEPDPATAVTVPLQVFDNPLGVATTSPAGRESVKPIPVNAPGFEAGFVIVKVRDVVPLTAIVETPNALEIVGGANTLSVAVLLVVPVPPSVDEIAPVIFAIAPAVVPVTLTVIVQEVLVPTVPPERLTVVSPAAGVKVPLQLLTTPGVAATCRPDGNVSLNASPLKPTVVFGLVIVKVIVVVPFNGMLGAPNALLIVGGATTVIGTVPVELVRAPVVVDEADAVLFFTPAVVP